MSAEPRYNGPLSEPTYHAPRLVARIDQMTLDEIVETDDIPCKQPPWPRRVGPTGAGEASNDAGETIEEPRQRFPSVAEAVAKGTRRLDRSQRTPRRRAS
jgi:hypothetical protein